MPSKSTPTRLEQTTKPRTSTAQRRDAEIAAVAGRQAQLKREAAERREERARREAEADHQSRHPG